MKTIHSFIISQSNNLYFIQAEYYSKIVFVSLKDIENRYEYDCSSIYKKYNGLNRAYKKYTSSDADLLLKFPTMEQAEGFITNFLMPMEVARKLKNC